MNAVTANIKVEPALDIVDTPVVYDHANTTITSIPSTNISSGKRQSDAINKNNERTVKKLKIVQEQAYTEEQQQWAAALQNDMLNTQFDNVDLDSDNFNAENDEEDAYTVTNGEESTVEAATNDSRAQNEQFLKLLTKHKLQSYFPKLKEMQIGLDYLRFVQEVDIIDIFERDIGARIRFRGVLEDWRVSKFLKNYNKLHIIFDQSELVFFAKKNKLEKIEYFHKKKFLVRVRMDSQQDFHEHLSEHDLEGHQQQRLLHMDELSVKIDKVFTYQYELAALLRHNLAPVKKEPKPAKLDFGFNAAAHMPQQLLSATPLNEATTFQESSNESIINCSRTIPKSSQTPNQIVNFLNEVASLKQNMDVGVKQSEKRHTELMKQNEMLCQQLMKQVQIMQSIADQCFPNAVDFKIIPLRSIEQILGVEENLDNYAKGEFLEYLKLHLGRDEISKCVTLLFTEKLLLDINWDGKKQKIALNKFKFFNTYLFEAIKKKEMTFPEFEAEMKKGFKLAKNKVYKNAAKEREKLQTTME